MGISSNRQKKGPRDDKKRKDKTNLIGEASNF